MTRFVLLFFCLSSCLLHAQYGALDPTFGNGGLVLTPSGQGWDVAIQPDGKILVTGVIIDSIDHLALIRYLSNGDRDSSFGDSGIVLLPDEPYGATGWRIALQADNKILVAGGHNFTSLEQPDLLLARFLPNGHLDTSFGTQGFVTWDALGDLEVTRAFVIQRDGKILLVGDAIETALGLRIFLVRFTADGDLDIDFGNHGSLILSYGVPIAEATGVAELEDGKLIVCATYKDQFTPETKSDVLLMRFMPDGTPDISFGNNGTLQHDFGFYEQTSALMLQPDGKILVGTNPEDPYYEFAVSRYLPDGHVDPGFGEGGLVIVEDGTAASAHEIAIQPDGKIVAVGFAKNVDPLRNDELVVARFLYNGERDLTFGDSGIVRTNFLPEARDIAMAVALQPDHKIVVTGYVHSATGFDIVVARYLSNYEPPPYDTLARDELFQLYPNPTSGAFTVQFGLSHTTTISLDMYDVQGRFIRTLLPTQIRAEGIYTEPLVLGADVPSGAYLLCLKKGENRSCIPIVKQY